MSDPRISQSVKWTFVWVLNVEAFNINFLSEYSNFQRSYSFQPVAPLAPQVISKRHSIIFQLCSFQWVSIVHQLNIIRLTTDMDYIHMNIHSAISYSVIITHQNRKFVFLKILCFIHCEEILVFYLKNFQYKKNG